MVDEKLLENWRITERYLKQAIALLPTDAVLECEDGSLEGCRNWIRHNELGLAFEDLDALGKVNAVPRQYWMALRNAAENMGLTESVEECNRILNEYAA